MSIIYPSIRNDWMSAIADDSIKYQTLKDIEVIKIDDPNLDCTQAENMGLDKAKGELITWAMDDDVQLLSKCEILAMYADKYPEYDIFYAGHIRIDEQGNFKNIFLPPPFDIEYFITHGNFVDSFVTTIRRERIGDIRFRADYPYTNEYLFWYELYLKGLQFKRINLPLAMLRQWNGARSSSCLQERYDELLKLRAEFGERFYSEHFAKKNFKELFFRKH